MKKGHALHCIFTSTDKIAFPFSSSSKNLFLFIICHSHSWTWTSPAPWLNERDTGSHYHRLSASFTAIDHYPKGPFGQNWLCSERRRKEQKEKGGKKKIMIAEIEKNFTDILVRTERWCPACLLKLLYKGILAFCHNSTTDIAHHIRVS